MKGEGWSKPEVAMWTSGLQEGAADTSLCLVLKCRSPLTGHQSSKQQPHRVTTPAWGEERKAPSSLVTSKTTKEQSPRSWHSRGEQGSGGPAAGKPCGRRTTVGERTLSGKSRESACSVLRASAPLPLTGSTASHQPCLSLPCAQGRRLSFLL